MIQIKDYYVTFQILANVSASAIFLDAADLITIVVPPALPAAMTIGSLYAQVNIFFLCKIFQPIIIFLHSYLLSLLLWTLFQPK